MLSGFEKLTFSKVILCVYPIIVTPSVSKSSLVSIKIFPPVAFHSLLTTGLAGGITEQIVVELKFPEYFL